MIDVDEAGVVHVTSIGYLSSGHYTNSSGSGGAWIPIEFLAPNCSSGQMVAARGLARPVVLSSRRSAGLWGMSRNAAADWSASVLSDGSTGPDQGHQPALLSVNGVAHACIPWVPNWYGTGSVNYAHFDGTNWSYTRLETDVPTVGPTAIGIDAVGSIYIAAHDLNHLCKIYTNRTGAWRTHSLGNICGGALDLVVVGPDLILANTSVSDGTLVVERHPIASLQ